VQQRDTVTVYVPVVGARPNPGEPWLEGAPALRRYQFWARRTARDDPYGATLIPFGIHDLETCTWLQAASGMLHDALLGRRVQAVHDTARLVVNVTTRDPPGVEGRSGTLGAACGEAAARWLRPGAPSRLPTLVATGELSAAGDDATTAGRTLLVKPVEGVAPKLACIQAMLAREPSSLLKNRGLVVALPLINLQSDGHDVAEVIRALADLEAFCQEAGLDVRVIRARTLADVLAAWCPRNAWCSAKAVAHLAGSNPVAAEPDHDGQILSPGGTGFLPGVKRFLDAIVHGQASQSIGHSGVAGPLVGISPSTSALLDPIAVSDLDAEAWYRRLGAVSYLSSVSRNGNPASARAAFMLLWHQLKKERDYDVRRELENVVGALSAEFTTIRGPPVEEGRHVLPVDRSFGMRQSKVEEPLEGRDLANIPEFPPSGTANVPELSPFLASGPNPMMVRQQVQKLANEYRTVRNSMKSGSSRTEAMEAVVLKMKVISRSIFEIRDELRESTSPGKHLNLIVSLQLFPDYRLIGWLSTRLGVEQPFIGYHALLALNIAATNEQAEMHKGELQHALDLTQSDSWVIGKDMDRTILLERLQLAISNLTSTLPIGPGPVPQSSVITVRGRQLR